MVKPKDKDRRAVLEQLRKQQQRAEKKRTSLVIVVSALVALAIIALPAWQLVKQERAAGQELESIGVPADAAGCQDVVTRSAEGNNDHRAEGSAIDYPDSPPIFGPHYNITAPFARKFYSASDRPDLPYLVHNLEHGYTLLWYDETVADDADQLADLKALAAKFEGEDLSDKFLVLPWTEQDGAPFPGGAGIALTHWSVGGDPESGEQVGVWQYCDAPSGEVVAQFVEDYPYSDSPEPGAM